jgi:sRNA-binding carbon storage regulator CsrA
MSATDQTPALVEQRVFDALPLAVLFQQIIEGLPPGLSVECDDATLQIIATAANPVRCNISAPHFVLDHRARRKVKNAKKEGKEKARQISRAFLKCLRHLCGF